MSPASSSAWTWLATYQNVPLSDLGIAQLVSPILQGEPVLGSLREGASMKPRFLLLLSLILGATAAPANEKPVAGESITVTVVGTLHMGILAIGGETTGTTITARGVTWELDLGGNAALREAAEVLSGKTVVVQGTLGRRSGVEIKERWIVTVTGLRAAGEAGAGTDRALGLLAAVGRRDTRISFQSEGRETVLDVRSDTGIDTATIRRMTEMWPERIQVRLHLGGLGA
jgi:hypothetical protein